MKAPLPPHVPVPTTVVIFEDDFESGFGKWKNDSNQWKSTTLDESATIPGHTSNNKVAKVGICSTSCWLELESEIDLTQYDNAVLEFDRFVDDEIDSGESLAIYLPYNTGTVFMSHTTWTDGQGDDDQWQHVSIDLAPYLSFDNFKIKFRGIVSSATEEVAIDNVRISHIANSTVFVEYFDSGLDNWTETGDGKWRITDIYNTGHAGYKKVGHADGCPNTCTLTLKTPVDLTPYASATLDLNLVVDGNLEAHEYLAIEVGSNNTWTRVYDSTQDWNNNWQSKSYDLSDYLTDKFEMRLIAHMSKSDEDVAVDNIMISGSMMPPPTPPTPPTTNPTTLDEDFESGLGDWTKTGNWKIKGLGNVNVAPIPGHTLNNIVAEADDCSVECRLTLSTPINLTSYTTAYLEFYRFVNKDIGFGEYLVVDVTGDNRWTPIFIWDNGDGDDTWRHESYNLTDYLTATDFKVRISAKANIDELAVDNIKIVSTKTMPPSVPNNSPQIGTISSTLSVTAGDRFTVDIDATDADTGDTLTYSLDTSPTGATINAQTGLVIWQTSSSTGPGNHRFGVTVSDSKTTASKSFTVKVHKLPPPNPILHIGDFESGFGNWTVSGNWQAETLDDANAAPIPGYTKSNKVAEADGCDTACTMTLTTPLDLSSYAGATLEFDRFEDGFLAPDDYLKVEIGQNGVYTKVLHYPDSTVNDVWMPETYNMSSYLTSGITIRFTAETTGNFREVAVDNINITGTLTTPGQNPTDNKEVHINTDTFDYGLLKWDQTGDGNWKIKKLGEKITIQNYNWNNLVAEADGCSNTCVLTFRTPIDLTWYSNATLYLDKFIDDEIDTGEYLKVEFFSGNRWTPVSYWDHNYANDTWSRDIYHLSNYLTTTDFNVRITAKADLTDEELAVDNVYLKGIPNPKTGCDDPPEMTLQGGDKFRRADEPNNCGTITLGGITNGDGAKGWIASSHVMDHGKTNVTVTHGNKELGTVITNPATVNDSIGEIHESDSAFVEYPKTCDPSGNRCDYDMTPPIESRKIANGDDTQTYTVTGSSDVFIGDMVQTTGVMSGEQTGIVMGVVRDIKLGDGFENTVWYSTIPIQFSREGIRGDSGSPIYTIPQSGNTKIVGHLVGSLEPGIVPSSKWTYVIPWNSTQATHGFSDP